MAALIATLPVQLACQLIHAGHYSPDNFTLAVDPNETQVLPDGYTSLPDIGVAYKYFAHQLTWNAARKLCIVNEGNLAVIDSLKKLNHLNSTRTNPHDAGIFVGIHRLYGDGEWVSVRTGLPVGVIPWAPGQQFSEDKANNCLSAWHDGRGLSAIPCDVPKHVICEIPLAVNKNENTAFKESQLIPN